jgi:predicted SprT family Zn-dependent metalloprotease
MGDRFRFECRCGQHLVAEQRLAGYRIRCPVCLQQLVVPAAGEPVNAAAYRRSERYVLVCACRYRMLVKAGTAGRTLHCPMCQLVIKVPTLEVLRRGTARVLVVKGKDDDRVRTEELILVVDDEGGPGSDVR